MTVSMIVAKGRNNEIGKNNDLLWHISEDLKFFKATTMGKSIIMGRKTFQSLPKALPGRKNIVISRNPDFDAPGAVVVTNAKDAVKESETEEVFIIGGGSIYNEFFPVADKLYITEVDYEDKEADVFFPEVDLSRWDKEILGEGVENSISYRFTLYTRKK